MTIFWRYLRDDRLSLLGWAVGVAGMAAMVVGMFPAMGESEMWGDLMARMPKWLQAFAGGAISIGTLDGWLSWEWFSWSSWLIGTAGALGGAAVIARDVETKSMEFLLAQPVRRWRVVVERYLSVAALLLVLSVVGAAALELGVRWVDKPASLGAYRIVALNGFVLTLVIAAFATLVSVLAGEQRRATVVAVGGLFGSYLVDVILKAADKGDWVRAFLPFHYYDVNAIVRTGHMPWGNIGILFAATVVLVAAAALAFERRDVAA